MRFVMASITALVVGFLLLSSDAGAHGPGNGSPFPNGSPYTFPGTGHGYSTYYGYYRNGGNPGGASTYYGNGGHDVYPHWHNTYTPNGAYSWYGSGRHDYLPHQHIVTPNSYLGRSYTPYGVTDSYYPRYPYYYAPW